MRKAVFIFGVIALMSTSCALFNQNKEEKFVNPLFYKTLISISHFTDKANITPSSVNIVEMGGFERNYKCRLVNNQMDSITLDCQKSDNISQKYETVSFTYSIKPCRQENACLDEGGWLVYQQMTPYILEKTTTYIIPSQSDDAPKDKFVNHLFYKKLSPISRGARPTFLTPTSQTYYDLYNNKVVRQCKMLENTPMFITLECSFYNDFLKDTQTDVYRYTLKKCDEQKEYCFDGEWFVLEKMNGVSTFVIGKKDMGQ